MKLPLWVCALLLSVPGPSEGLKHHDERDRYLKDKLERLGAVVEGAELADRLEQHNTPGDFSSHSHSNSNSDTAGSPMLSSLHASAETLTRMWDRVKDAYYGSDAVEEHEKDALAAIREKHTSVQNEHMAIEVDRMVRAVMDTMSPAAPGGSERRPRSGLRREKRRADVERQSRRIRAKRRARQDPREQVEASLGHHKRIREERRERRRARRLSLA